MEFQITDIEKKLAEEVRALAEQLNTKTKELLQCGWKVELCVKTPKDNQWAQFHQDSKVEVHIALNRSFEL